MNEHERGVKRNPAIASVMGMIGAIAELRRPGAVKDADRREALEEKNKAFADVIANSSPQDRAAVGSVIQALQAPEGNEGIADDIKELIKQAEERKDAAK